MKPDKTHTRYKLVKKTCYSFQKHSIHLRERTEPHGYKPNYKVQVIYYTEHSHGEENIEVYKKMNESSKKDKEDAEDSEERKTPIKI